MVLPFPDVRMPGGISQIHLVIRRVPHGTVLAWPFTIFDYDY